MRRLVGKPEGAWLAGALIAAALLAGSLFVPLWKMELVAPQYPRGLQMYAYGNRFAGNDATHYDDVREINGLNHYIGMKPIKEVSEMDLFVPGVVALILGALVVSFVSWKRAWFRALIVASFWFVPLFFVADLQYWLYHYGHTMDPEAPLNPGDFTPKVIGTTKVWNFHSENSFDLGFYLMVLAALAVTFLPPLIRLIRGRRLRRATREEARVPQAAAGHARWSA